MHLGSPILTTDPYAAAAKKAVEIVAEFRAKGHPDTIGSIWAADSASVTSDEGPSRNATYAEVIVPACRQPAADWRLEPGRFICGNAGVLISRVIFTKREGGKLFIIQDAAMNDLARPSLYDAFHRIWPVRSGQAEPDDFEEEIPGCEPADVVGPICESGDVLAKDRWLPGNLAWRPDLHL